MTVTTLTPDKVIEMLVKSVGVSLGLYLSQPLNNIIVIHCVIVTNMIL